MEEGCVEKGEGSRGVKRPHALLPHRLTPPPHPRLGYLQHYPPKKGGLLLNCLFLN